MDENKLRERLLAVMDYLLVLNPKEFKTKTAVSKYIGYPQSNLSAALSGTERYLTEAIILKFTNAFEWLSYEWLKYGKGEMIKSDDLNIDIKTEFKGLEKSSRVIDLKDLHSVKTYIIPIKGRAGLQCNYYDDVMFEELETEELLTNDAHFGKYFKVEVEGDSMDNGGPKDLQHGDWAYCRSVPKLYWRDKLHFNKYRIWCFFHNERGIIFKSIISHNSETGELELKSLNEDKDQYPNFKINVGECSYICNVVKKISSL